MSDKQMRERYGRASGPIPASRVLVKDLDPKYFGGGEPKALIAINDDEGTFTAANVFGDGQEGYRLGRNYDPTAQTHALPPQDDERWKQWGKKGYVEGDVEYFDVLAPIKAKAKARA